jgi:hydroxyacylglutathione hydrolase
MLEVELVACRTDNYAVVLHDGASNVTVLIDAPEAGPIEEVLRRNGWRLSHILITHHHDDHVAGLESLCRRDAPEVVAPARELPGNPHATQRVGGGDVLDIGGHRIDVLDTPGHTAGHVSYYWPQDKLLFAGDTLFSLGCGRALECAPQVLWKSLLALRALPDGTALYCGHEYTKANARFALSVDGTNTALQDRARAIDALRAAGRPTLPALLGDEKRTNPFLRADDAGFAHALGKAGCPPEEVFTFLRQAKDNF